MQILLQMQENEYLEEIYYEPNKPNFDLEKLEQIKDLLNENTSTSKEFNTNPDES